MLEYFSHKIKNPSMMAFSPGAPTKPYIFAKGRLFPAMKEVWKEIGVNIQDIRRMQTERVVHQEVW